MKLELTKWQADLLFIIVNEAVVRALKRDLPEQNQLYRELLFVIANQFAKQEARYPKKDKDV